MEFSKKENEMILRSIHHLRKHLLYVVSVTEQDQFTPIIKIEISVLDRLYEEFKTQRGEPLNAS